ncbi:MAG: CPBP family intramembrane metalloprotease, partial [Ktedonobacteraceae bacterium]|nr:CPBP family intramembrane metalloprotease [Ktedonobacteraceae bacterium]
ALVFGLTRLNGGIMVAVSAFLFGLIFSLLYFLARQNLWACIVAHGVSGVLLLLLSLLKG